jgi:hypothetical protein
MISAVQFMVPWNCRTSLPEAADAGSISKTTTNRAAVYEIIPEEAGRAFLSLPERPACCPVLPDMGGWPLIPSWE